ncbi:methylenetetrahydrofolate reductase [Actinomycetospora lemnae]|uniref:Methylenetetrahydrofolate reductase n=1 Tax=Actinomycetospora lemnae TaxID=3019891 RepID=A0ABT5SNM3_9PSEU|nr:methylenetetrahydrofolate reductase [Actinomycetospora sp. DW7H6]MDD7964432.1 methylenetetrahydrofolate reductase [Actinomycetospora sp. DW7H6]
MDTGPVDVEGMRATARRLARAVSIEVTPREQGALDDVAGLLPPGTPVYVTFLANVGFDRVLATARRARELGLRPVVHLAVRAVPDLDALDRTLGRLVDDGVRDLLLVAGSIEPVGTIDNTLQVLESAELARRAFASIGVAGHPEGNPGVDERAVDDALARKNKIAAESGLPLHVVTQFAFAPEPIVAWERRAREAGNTLPVHVGLPGLTSPATLLRFGLACGVGPSLAVLRKQSGSVLRLATQTYRPDETLAGLVRAATDDPDSRIAGVHLFPFGAVKRTARWAAALREGRVEVREDGTLDVAD